MLLREHSADSALRVGDIVEVRSEAEILQTLDADGKLEGLPFMPEMLEFCGKRLTVYKRADKVCDTVSWGTLRRMEGAVHLAGARCTGANHGGCQAGCLIHWKEAWLKRVEPGPPSASTNPEPVAPQDSSGDRPMSRDNLFNGTTTNDDSGEPIFVCQATEMITATTSPIPWWNPVQYVTDVRSGNAGVRQVVRGLAAGFLNKFQQANRRIAPRWTLIQSGRNYPFLLGKGLSAPVGDLNLQPGDLVQVKTKEEIFETLNENDSTRGLRFDGEMLSYCGRQGRVLKRVDKIIDEATGRMLSLKSDCIIIDEFICRGDFHRSCPRGVYPYWREAWLRRVE